MVNIYTTGMSHGKAKWISFEAYASVDTRGYFSVSWGLMKKALACKIFKLLIDEGAWNFVLDGGTKQKRQ